MSGVLTSSKLINSIKRRAMIPSDQTTFTDEDFLDMLNEEIQYFGLPHLLQTYEEYLLFQEDVELDGGREYEIPYRAIGNKLRELSYVLQDAGNEQIHELSRIQVEDLPDYNSYSSNQNTESFYLKGNKVVLMSESNLTQTILRMHYYLRPNMLVDEDRVGTITSIDTSTGIITLSKFPDNFSVLPLMDTVKHQSPNNIMSVDKQPIAVNSTTRTVTFATADLPISLQVGDYLCEAQETPVPQLPVELHAVLAQRAAVQSLEALGDQEGLVSAQKRLDSMERATNTLIDNRVEGAPKKITNRHGPLRESTARSSSGKGRF